MAARNPGPRLNQVPVGFPSFHRKNLVDSYARKALFQSEVNTRVYKNVFANLGYQGPIDINHIIGKNRVRMRCIDGGRARGVFRWTRMWRMQFRQAEREGWLRPYGLSRRFWR
ncbi:unnamed protein product [Vitrella brassicaformis CCMP3155]|uniref:Ribosomal protein S14 n=1 Tax=Vitrella brassicaformis (strain CCMP3155) TaxID=1169540 RepID=A0A0G4GLN2_VITBC|nr:unnamed protein product [Vitrella brassicaformis CCMP3155]|mmetsp:Transcript_54091/g.136102  ORF Transcript_54091/g.136102 Transcript_54091/m.136102 type:complete len:113 (-) Transcript_54091:302-640(-)|eukprot:CEM30988.1 unnamed protein product [Vitrella brassicaformis CCMP3155]